VAHGVRSPWVEQYIFICIFSTGSSSEGSRGSTHAWRDSSLGSMKGDSGSESDELDVSKMCILHVIDRGYQSSKWEII
jgi:hypothetical protein